MVGGASSPSETTPQSTIADSGHSPLPNIVNRTGNDQVQIKLIALAKLMFKFRREEPAVQGGAAKFYCMYEHCKTPEDHFDSEAQVR